VNDFVFLAGLAAALLLAVGPAAWVVRRDRERRDHRYAEEP